MNANFSFEPEKYWSDVSETAKDFIRKLLVAQPEGRLTAQEALNHPWLQSVAKEAEEAPVLTVAGEANPTGQSNLLPGVKENFNARKAFKRAVGLVKAVNRFKRLQQPPVEEDLNEEGQHVFRRDDSTATEGSQ